MTNTIHPCLWFDGQSKKAADFYCSIFPNSRITIDTPMVVNFELNGKKIMGLNGGPIFKINPSISFFVECRSLQETNEIWERLFDGGKALMAIDKYPWSEIYGWVQDRFGMTWQVMLSGDAVDTLKITPSFLFTSQQFGRAEAAIDFYTSIFDHSAKDLLVLYEPETEYAGKILFSRFTINQYPVIAMDGPGVHDYTFNEAVSFVVDCETQEEVDYYWNKLAEGGKESQCGWLKDKFGVSWQIVPAILGKLMSDRERAPRVVKAFMKMKKFDIQKLIDA
jgi:predicted 3-demethylubiquinone-9 3-methyltransferase (glyoxalase superfamily)